MNLNLTSRQALGLLLVAVAARAAFVLTKDIPNKPEIATQVAALVAQFALEVESLKVALGKRW